MRTRALLIGSITLALIAPATGRTAPVPVAAQDRSVDPVVLTGDQFPSWSAGPDPTLREPSVPHNYETADIEESLPEQLRSECYQTGQYYPNPYDPEDNGDHNCYQSSRLPRNPNEGAPVDRLLGFRWTPEGWIEIPFQVDERFTRYLTNNYSGFAFYSGTDAHTTYAWDREAFRYTSDQSREFEGGDPCLARPALGSTIVNGYATTPDPVVGLDNDDELVFMWSDAGAAAPPGTLLPEGIESAYEIAVADPSNPASAAFAYVMLGAHDGRLPSFDATNGYVRYQRDTGPNPHGAELFVYSQSSYDGYGAAPKGPVCNLDGTPDTSHGAIAQRRPLDWAWVKTPRYHFRYDGRWLMTQLRISPDDSGLADTPNLGQDIIDQWKARAFQQRPGGETPCCGYEEEVNNWGGSSTLFGERWGPVRAVRATWGADSSTNNIKTEIFYRDQILFDDHLRVHVIPPFDGIYVQWDHNAGTVDTYYNPYRPDGVPIDGQDDEVVGNSYLYLAGDQIRVQDGDVDVAVPLSGENPGGCDLGGESGVCNDVDSPDPLFSGPLGSLYWEQISGDNGTIVTRWTIKEHTAGDAYSLLALPYYRDDSCFDDGTGSDPGPHLRGRAVDEGGARADRGETFEGNASTYRDADSGAFLPRECWTTAHGDPATDASSARRFWQGDIATHGLHLQLIADSDNANLTVPVDEIVSEQRMVVLQGDPGNVGETYGRSVEFPLAPRARPYV